jgi:ATP-dependent DNA helicase RecG
MYSDIEVRKVLDELLSIPSENEYIEFKEAKTTFEIEKLGQYFSAISNEANLNKQKHGWLILGVKDKPPRIIVGTNFKKELHEKNELKRDISNGTNGITLQGIYDIIHPDGRVLMFQIPAAPMGIPTSWKGHYYGREGESLVSLSMNKLEALRVHRGLPDWSSEICPKATMADLDKNALNLARDKFKKKHQTRATDDVDDWDDITFLEKAKLAINQQLTKAAILLLGKPESAHHLTPNPAQISWKLDTEEQAYDHFGPPFLIAVEKVFQCIRNPKFRFQPANQLIPIELIKYEPKVILEAINNCVAHQDYSQNARIIVSETNDKLCFQNIGSFYQGSVDDYLFKSFVPDQYRNPFLVQAMVNLDMIDTMGMGIRRMYIEQRKRYFPLPDFDLSEPNRVRLTIHGKLINEDYSKLLIEKRELTLSEVLALDSIQKNRKISKEIIDNLKKKKLVEGRYPNIFISSQIAEIVGEKAQYFKNKGIDDTICKQLIISFLNQHRSASRVDINNLLISRLPGILTDVQKKNKIKNILSSLRQEGKIINAGSDKKPKWVIKT